MTSIRVSHNKAKVWRPLLSHCTDTVLWYATLCHYWGCLGFGKPLPVVTSMCLRSSNPVRASCKGHNRFRFKKRHFGPSIRLLLRDLQLISLLKIHFDPTNELIIKRFAIYLCITQENGHFDLTNERFASSFAYRF